MVTSSRRYHDVLDPHRSGSWLSDIVLGGQDGLVNVLGVLLGVAAATSDGRVVIAAGLATTFAESLSMAAVAYTSKGAQSALYASERAREYRHVERVPELERDEIRTLYRRKGLEGDMLERVVDTLTQNRDVWVAVMMSEEHHIVPVSGRDALRSAAVVGVSSALGSLVPLVPFWLLSVRAACFASVLLASGTLFSLGAYKARVTAGSATRSGLEIALIGTVSALVGYLIGALFAVPTTP